MIHYSQDLYQKSTDKELFDRIECQHLLYTYILEAQALGMSVIGFFGSHLLDLIGFV